MPNINNTTVRTGLGEQAIVERLERAGLLRRVEGTRGQYIFRLPGSSVEQRFSRATIVARLTYRHGDRYYWRSELNQRILNVLAPALSEMDTMITVGSRMMGEEASQSTPPTPPPAPQPPVLRTITRYSYHSQSRNVSEALERLTSDADGVKRSFGLEWEIYYLNTEQEDKLARLLDELPPHITERDSSLDNNRGVEIIFEPMAEGTFLTTFKKLQVFCTSNNVDMRNTGAHTTYGVNNSSVSQFDLQIRLNRLALAVKAVGTQRNIKRFFGRDYTSYAMLPSSTTQQGHSMAFSASRGTSAWECRLINWQANVDTVVEFLRATEFVFTRVVKASDFMRVFEIMGADTSEA